MTVRAPHSRKDGAPPPPRRTSASLRLDASTRRTLMERYHRVEERVTGGIHHVGGGVHRVGTGALRRVGAGVTGVRRMGRGLDTVSRGVASGFDKFSTNVERAGGRASLALFGQDAIAAVQGFLDGNQV